MIPARAITRKAEALVTDPTSRRRFDRATLYMPSGVEVVGSRGVRPHRGGPGAHASFKKAAAPRPVPVRQETVRLSMNVPTKRGKKPATHTASDSCDAPGARHRPMRRGVKGRSRLRSRATALRRTELSASAASESRLVERAFARIFERPGFDFGRVTTDDEQVLALGSGFLRQHRMRPSASSRLRMDLLEPFGRSRGDRGAAVAESAPKVVERLDRRPRPLVRRREEKERRKEKRYPRRTRSSRATAAGDPHKSEREPVVGKDGNDEEST